MIKKKKFGLFVIIFMLFAMFGSSMLQNNFNIFLTDELILETLYAAESDSQISYQSDNMSVQVISETNYVSESYLDAFSIPTSLFRYSNNGGAENPLSNAFDRNWGTFFKSGFANDVTVTDPVTGENIPNFNNYIEIDFNNKKYDIDRIIYQSENYMNGRGYPVKLRIYAKTDGDFEEVGYIESVATAKVVMFSLNNSVSCTAIKFEWEEVLHGHSYNVTAREIILLQPETQEVKDALNIFSDYAMLKVSPTITSVEDIKIIREKLQGMASYEKLNELLNRAEQILLGTISYDPYREFGTGNGIYTKINRYGDVAGYARNTLKMTWFGTNRQATGISVNAGETLTIYVTAGSTDKLPKLVYTQHWGHWGSWQSGELELKPGKNTIVARNFVNSNYSVTKELVSGGPVYLSNPYTESEQSSDVKIYIEGGTIFPVYRMGEDEEGYKSQLASYISTINNNPKNVVNVTELVSNHFIMTVRATSAYDVYKTKSPEKNLANWDEYIEDVLAFDGVQFSSDQPYYDYRTAYINCNIRLMQPYGAAYAYGEHIGIQPDWEYTAIYAGEWGWGYTHELGHMMDLSGRIVSECSNNMVSKYIETTRGDASRGNFDLILKNLTPDTKNSDSFFNSTSRMDFLIWWLIESYQSGWWSKLENLYRYTTVNGINSTEKQVYLSSVASGIDLSYYFERWGYNLSTGDPVFNTSTASDEFKNLMAQAKQSGKIRDDIQPKLWYLDAKQYLEVKDGYRDCYLNQNVQPSIVSVAKGTQGYTLILSSPKSASREHLGYEIWEGTGDNSKIIGFTYTNSFTDTTSYPVGYTPTYKILAYDRGLNSSDASEYASVLTQNAVCKIGNDFYNSISEAILAAKSGDTIVILKDIKEGGIVIDKNLTITIDDSSPVLTLYKTISENFITINSGVTLNIKGNDKLVFDGLKILQNGSMFKVNGILNIERVIIQNCKTTSDGSAINMSSTSRLTASYVEFKDNSANGSGGAIYAFDTNEIVLIENCKFIKNTAKNGGAIMSRASITINDCIFEQNSASVNGGAIANYYNSVTMTINGTIIQNNRADIGGGIFADGKIIISGGKIKQNSATLHGGGIAVSTATNARTLNTDNNLIISENDAPDGSAIYFSGTTGTLKATIISENSGEYPISVATGTLNIYGNSTILADIYKAVSTKIVLYDSMFNTNGKTILINVEGMSDNTILMEANNFKFGENETQIITLLHGFAKIDETNAKIIVAKNLYFTVTFIIDGVSNVQQVLIGSDIILSMQSGISGKYISHWIKDEQRFEVNSTIIVTENMVFTAMLENTVYLTLIYSNEFSEQIELIPGSDYVLPKTNYQKAEVMYWLDEVNQNLYLPYNTITICDNITLSAVIQNKIEVKFLMNNNGIITTITTKYVNYGEMVTFPPMSSFDLPDGKDIKHWELNGEILDNNYYIVTKPLTFTAVLSDGDVYFTYYCIKDGGEPEIAVDENGEIIYGSAPKNTYHTITLPYILDRYYLDKIELSIGWESDNNIIIDTANAYFLIEEDWNVVFVYFHLKTKTYSVTYSTMGEIIFEHIVDYGTLLTLGDGVTIPQGYTLSHFIFSHENREVGYQVEVYEDITIEIVLIPIKVNVTYLIDGFDYKVIEVDYGSSITLNIPENLPKGRGVDYYLVNGTRYELADSITITGDTTINLVTKEVIEKFTVTYQLDGVEYNSVQVDYNTQIILKIPDNLPKDREADYYFINDKKYTVGDTITITDDTVINLITKKVSSDNQGENNNQSGEDNQGNQNDSDVSVGGLNIAIIIGGSLVAVFVIVGTIMFVFMIKKRKPRNN